MSIKIDEQHASTLLAFVNSQIEEAECRILELREFQASIQAQVSSPVKTIVMGATVGAVLTHGIGVNGMNGYKTDWSWIKKATYALKKNGRQLTTAQIAEYLSPLDNEIRKDRARAVRNMSSVLGMEAKKENSNVSRTPNGAENLWDYHE